MADRSIFRFLIITLLVMAAIEKPAGGEGASARDYGPGGAGLVEENVSSQTLLERAREAFLNHQWSLAEQYYQSVLIRDTNNLDAVLELASLYESTGKLEYARGLLIRACAIDPYDKTIVERSARIAQELSSALRDEVDTLIENELFENAIPKLSLLLTLEPECAELRYKKAFCHYKVGREEIALLEIEQALRLENREEFHDLHFKITEDLKHQELRRLISQTARLARDRSPEKKEKTLDLLTEILRIDPNNPWATHQFTRLSEERSEGGNDSPEEGSRVKPWPYIAQISQNAGEAFVSISLALFQNLDVLFALLFILVLLSSPLTFFIIRGFSPRPLISGRMPRFTILEILTLLNANEHTGTLFVRGRSVKGKIYFEKGEAYHCQSGGLEGREAVTHILKKAKKGYFVFVETSLSIKRTIETPLSLILMGLPDRKPTTQMEKVAKRRKSRIKKLLDSSS